MMEVFTLILAVSVITLIVVVVTRWRKRKTLSKSNISKTDIPPRFRAGIQGVARGVENQDVSLSSGEGTEEFLAFRLEVVDNEGNIQDLIPVETQAREILGKIKEGDTLVVLGKRNRQGLLKPKSIYNVSTRLEIKTKGYTFFGTAVGCLMGLLFTASVFGLIGGAVLLLDEDPAVGVLILVASAILMVFSIYMTNKNRR